MQQEGDVIVISWGEVEDSRPVTYELQLKIGGQDFTQVYRGSSPSHTHTITSPTHHQARVRTSTSCLTNNRKEQLFSSFSATASCDPVSKQDKDVNSSTKDDADATNAAEKPGPSPRDEQQSWNWLVLMLFVGVSILVVVIGILLGNFLVSS
jgi:hypothetical protein